MDNHLKTTEEISFTKYILMRGEMNGTEKRISNSFNNAASIKERLRSLYAPMTTRSNKQTVEQWILNTPLAHNPALLQTHDIRVPGKGIRDRLNDLEERKSKPLNKMWDVERRDMLNNVAFQEYIKTFEGLASKGVEEQVRIYREWQYKQLYKDTGLDDRDKGQMVSNSKGFFVDLSNADGRYNANTGMLAWYSHAQLQR
jgi:hypothetical protein